MISNDLCSLNACFVNLILWGIINIPTICLLAQILISVPVLIAIDQWNAFIDKNTNDVASHPIARLFGRFSRFTVKNGLYLIAVSSSLIHMSFDDGDEQFSRFTETLESNDIEHLVAYLGDFYGIKIGM